MADTLRCSPVLYAAVAGLGEGLLAVDLKVDRYI
jgi:hypothetical protein